MALVIDDVGNDSKTTMQFFDHVFFGFDKSLELSLQLCLPLNVSRHIVFHFVQVFSEYQGDHKDVRLLP